MVSGRTSTYYARQLACAAAADVLGHANGLRRPGDVKFDIQVMPSAPKIAKESDQV